jgi:diguanylate cyclase (GGDEF)-like protein/PAS domain S-box-containing protein
MMERNPVHEAECPSREATGRSHRLLLALSQAAQAVQQARTAEEVYRTVLSEIGALGHHATVCTLTEDRRRLVMLYMTIDSALVRAAERLTRVSAKDFSFSVPKGGFYERVIAKGETVFSEQSAEFIAEALPGLARPLTGQLAAVLRIQQAIYAPLRTGDGTQGLLTIWGAGLSKADMPAVTTFASQIAIALENVRLYEAVQQELAERKRAEEALRESEEKYRTLFEQSKDAVYITARDGWFIDTNRSFLDLFGYAREEMLGLNARQVYADPAARPKFRQAVEEKDGVVDYELRLRKKDGTEIDCLVTATVRAGRDGSLLGYQGSIRDISEQKRAQETIKRLAHHDALTGLANRTLFNDRLSVALAHAHRNQHELAVMLLDLDQFKQINDTLGHPAGDRLLQAVGERLTDRLRGEDTVCRMGGDEFLLLLPEMASAKDAGRVCEGILKVIRQPIALNGREVRSTASLGLAVYPYDGEDADALVKNADIAMYRAKEEGRDNYQRYSNGGPEAVPALNANVRGI